MGQSNMNAAIDLAILNHHKCASNWMRAICRELEVAGLIAHVVVGAGSRKAPEGEPPASARRVVLDVNAYFAPGRSGHFKAKGLVHFVRDPRDALVSNYWSWLKSHQNNTDTILGFRERAATLSVEEGLIELIDAFPMGQQLRTWNDAVFAAVKRVRYEDMLENFDVALADMFALGGVELTPDIVEGVKAATSFEKITGRKPGDENVNHHFRKGVAGDWENYFTPAVSRKFYDSYGWLGERLGYW
jgi:hypothetical protein